MRSTLTVAQDADETAVYGWDWSATTHDARGSGLDVQELAARLATDLPGSDRVLMVDKGLQGWTDSLDVFDVDGFRLGRVYYGGDRTDVHLVSTSEAADFTREFTVANGGKTARVDTRVDTLVPFDELSQIMLDAASRYGSQITRYETLNPRTGDTDGRTLYLGAPSSAIRVRLYEKWLESPGQYAEGTNRLEVQLRPPSKVKEKVSGWSRAETFCASRVTRDLAERLGADLAPAASLHVRRGTPELEQSLAAMGAQYGNAVRRWMEVSHGDIGTLIDYMLVKS